MPTSVGNVSQTSRHDRVSRAQLLMWGAAAIFVIVLMGLIVGAPLAMAHGHVSIGFVIYKGFSPLCHQLSERSFHVEGHAFAVCSRCTGIYAGFAGGVVFYPLVRSLKRIQTPRRVWLLLASLPIAADWLLGFTGIWANTPISRFLTGALLGSVCALYVMPGLIDMLEIDWRHFFTKTATVPALDRSTAMPISHDRNAPSDYSSPSSRI